MSRPIISICVANYQGERVIEACLESLLSQVCTVPFEVIVYDDASPDNSGDLVIRQFPGVRLIAGENNVGYCQANRIMVEEAKGDYLLLFNNDAWLLPGSLQALFEGAQGIGSSAILGLPQFNAATGVLEDFGRVIDPFFNAVPNLISARQDVAMVAGACLWLPKDLWGRLGGFPDWFESTGEDLYLCCAARLHGYPVRVLQAGGFHHWIGHSIGGGKVSGGRLASTSGRRFRSERNKLAVVIACFPAPFNYLWALVIALLLLLEGGCLAFVKGSISVFTDIYLRALFDLVKRRGDVAEIVLKPKPSLRCCLGFLGVMTWIPYKLSLLWRHGVPEIERRR